MEIFYVLTKLVQSRLLQNCRMREINCIPCVLPGNQYLRLEKAQMHNLLITGFKPGTFGTREKHCTQIVKAVLPSEGGTISLPSLFNIGNGVPKQTTISISLGSSSTMLDTCQSTRTSGQNRKWAILNVTSPPFLGLKFTPTHKQVLFYAFVADTFWKHCCKMRNCSKSAIFFFAILIKIYWIKVLSFLDIFHIISLRFVV